MGRMGHIARRVAVAETVAASLFSAKDRPDDLFAGVFFDIREKAKALKTQWEDEAVTNIEKSMLTDLAKAGFRVVELKISLGQYRGSRFVTSAKLSVETGSEERAGKLLSALQTKYSPKYKMKSFADGVSTYNVR